MNKMSGEHVCLPRGLAASAGVCLKSKETDVPDFSLGSGRSGIRPFLANPAKSGSGQIFGQISAQPVHTGYL